MASSALNLIPMGYQQITDLSSSIGFTLPVNAAGQTANFAVVIPQSQAVRWRDDGTAPTATVGMPLASGAALEYDGNLAAVKFIQQAASGALNVSYYRG